MATRAKELSDLGNLKLDVTANGIDVVGVGSNFKSESYNILNIQTDTDDNGSSDDGIFKITNGAAGTTKAEFRWDESEDLVHVSYGDHGRHISINSDGNVGIGTGSSSPVYPLSAVTDVDSFVMKVENDGNSPGTVGNSYTDASDGLWVDTRWNTATNTPFKVTSNSGTSPMMIIKGDGKVGIGTASPEVKLEVNGGADGSVVFGGRSDGGNGNNRRFNLIAYADGGGANYGGGLKIQTRDSVNVFHDRITVQSDGNVGIGNTNPNKPLTVTADSGANGIALRARSAGDYSFIQFFNNAGDALRGQIYSNAAGDIGFTTGTDSSAGNDLYIKNGGYVGIGNDPSDKLDIQGADNGITVRSISANRPVITLVNDTTNMLQLSANGTYGAIGDGTDANRYFIFNDGDVGLAGVTDPRNKLHVGGAICNNKGVTNGTGIVQTVGRGMYHVLLTNNYGAGSAVRHAAYYVCVDYEGDDIVATNEIYNNNSMSVSFSISSGWLTVNSLPAGNNNVAVFGM